MSARLELDLPWLEERSSVGGLTVERGTQRMLEYDDGIRLSVLVIDPRDEDGAEEVVARARAAAAPGRVVLVAGSVPLPWRAELRSSGVSFVDASGTAEIAWPRLRLSSRQFGRAASRRRRAVPLQQGHALVTQMLVVFASDGSTPSVGELAESAAVSHSTASKAVSQLEAQGLVRKHRAGPSVRIDVVDVPSLVDLLATRTGWPGAQVLDGYLWGSTVFEVAATLSDVARKAGVAAAVTGRVGAAFHGVLGTSSPAQVRCWVHTGECTLDEVAAALQLEPADAGEANVLLSDDRWRTGTHGRGARRFESWSADVAHPLRVWCDLRDEPRGRDVAAQMWRVVDRAR